MHQLKHRLSVLLNITDKISYGILFFVALGTILNLDLFALNPDNYDRAIQIAYISSRHLFLYLAVLILLSLIRTKCPKIKYVEAFLWIVFFFYVPCLLHQIPSVSEAYDQAAYGRYDWRIIGFEYSFYVFLILLAVISMLYKGQGKYALFLVCFLFLSPVSVLPEFKEITALESCNEGKCAIAEKMGIIKIENERIIYIPKNKR